MCCMDALLWEGLWARGSLSSDIGRIGAVGGVRLWMMSASCEF